MEKIQFCTSSFCIILPKASSYAFFQKSKTYSFSIPCSFGPVVFTVEQLDEGLDLLLFSKERYEANASSSIETFNTPVQRIKLGFPTNTAFEYSFTIGANELLFHHAIMVEKNIKKYKLGLTSNLEHYSDSDKTFLQCIKTFEIL